MMYNVLNTNFLFALMNNFSFAEQRLIGYEQMQKEIFPASSEALEVDPNDRSSEINEASEKLAIKIKELESRTGKMGTKRANQWEVHVWTRRSEIQTEIDRSNKGDEKYAEHQRAALDAIAKFSNELDPVLAHKFTNNVERTGDTVTVTVRDPKGKFKPNLRSGNYWKNGTLNASGEYEWKIPVGEVQDTVVVDYNDPAAKEPRISISTVQAPITKIDGTLPPAKPKMVPKDKDEEEAEKKKDVVKEVRPPSTQEVQKQKDLADEAEIPKKTWEHTPQTTDNANLAPDYEEAGQRLAQLNAAIDTWGPSRGVFLTEEQNLAQLERVSKIRDEYNGLPAFREAASNSYDHFGSKTPFNIMVGELNKKPKEMIKEIELASDRLGDDVAFMERQRIEKEIDAAEGEKKVDVLVQGLGKDSPLAKALQACVKEVKEGAGAEGKDDGITVPELKFVGTTPPTFEDKFLAYDNAVTKVTEQAEGFQKIRDASISLLPPKEGKTPMEIVYDDLEWSRRNTYLVALKKFVLAVPASLNDTSLEKRKENQKTNAVQRLDIKAMEIMTLAEKIFFRKGKNERLGIREKNPEVIVGIEEALTAMEEAKTYLEAGDQDGYLAAYRELTNKLTKAEAIVHANRELNEYIAFGVQKGIKEELFEQR